jgi:hypothetical protein
MVFKRINNYIAHNDIFNSGKHYKYIPPIQKPLKKEDLDSKTSFHRIILKW